MRFVKPHIARLGRKLELCRLLSKVTHTNSTTLSPVPRGMMSLCPEYERSAYAAESTGIAGATACRQQQHSYRSKSRTRKLCQLTRDRTSKCMSINVQICRNPVSLTFFTIRENEPSCHNQIIPTGERIAINHRLPILMHSSPFGRSNLSNRRRSR